MTLLEKNKLFEELAESLDIPRSYYDKAVGRYNSIGDWFHRPESAVARFDPSVYPQGSFRLGTVNRPLTKSEEYDLDIVCELRDLRKADLSQKALKEMLGAELELYRSANRIEAPLVERNRCWRFDYADEVKFHIDNLPCVPEESVILEKSIRLGADRRFVQAGIALTCRTDDDYEVLSENWPTSNPGGYSVWFEYRCGPAADERRRVLVMEGLYKSVDAVPAYAIKTPLQRAIQILKRHRDMMFQNDSDLKPISIILTTLAAHAYSGEIGLYETVKDIVARMPLFVQEQRPRIANPVNPDEDFADKWLAAPELEENFWRWHQQASIDFELMATPRDASYLKKLTESKLGIKLKDQVADRFAERPASHFEVAAPAIKVDQGPRPWSRDA